MHRLLARQLRRFGAVGDQPPAKWQLFVQAVSDAYQATDSDRVRLERSMDLMSKELTERNEQLRADIRDRERVEEALRASEAQLRKEVADRERMEVELRLKQKLESVGHLAAGIAHEINTPVQYVGDSVHFLKSAFEDYRALLEQYRVLCLKLCTEREQQGILAALRNIEEATDLQYLDEQVPKAFDRVFDGTGRVASIVRAVKEFAHPDQRAKAPADINRALQSTLTVARNEYKYAADVETDLGDLPPVECHIGDLNQVFLNLIVNAAHAIVDRNSGDYGARGLITITTRVAGGHVRISVSDTGCGIPENVRDRIFDPFFTTKEVGRGTGQGLAICQSIVVEKHRGELTFETKVGEGTTFVVQLPIKAPAAFKEAP